jgi:hypothetical protein
MLRGGLSEADVVRAQALAHRLIGHYEVDLTGLTVLTEAASGPYLTTPLLAALAGADRVLAVTRDSAWATAEDVRLATEATASEWGVADRVEVTSGPAAEVVAEADIVTNSGFVRPIDADTVARMKPTAVVPLMWETWELRPGDVDLDACRARGILVLGTCESRPPCDLTGYAPFIALKLLFDLGLEGFRTRLLLLGGQPTLGAAMAAGLPELGVEVSWFATAGTDGARPYEELAAHVEDDDAGYDALIVAEHSDDRLLLGHGGVLDPTQLAKRHPALRVGVISGAVDPVSLADSGLTFAPSQIAPFGHMSYQASELGPLPVLELYAAGLRVGEAMARARRAGATPDQAAREALATSPAMDFDGERAQAR